MREKIVYTLGAAALLMLIACGTGSPPTKSASEAETDRSAGVTSKTDCGYLTGDDRAFTADAVVENPGPKAVTVVLEGEWFLAGGTSVTDSKRATVPAGESIRIGIAHKATLDEILAHQEYEVGDDCSTKLSTVRSPDSPTPTAS